MSVPNISTCIGTIDLELWFFIVNCIEMTALDTNSQGFFCMDGTFPPGVVADGCRKKCEQDEVLIVNVAKNEWECVPKAFR